MSLALVAEAAPLDSLLFPVYGTSDSLFRATPRMPASRNLRTFFDTSRERASLNLLKVMSPKVLRKIVRKVISLPPVIGIDLSKKAIEVRKLFYAAFARGLAKDGYDPEECLQEVYRGLLTRNNGTCPFDSRKSSFGHYVHIVTRCVLANYIRKERRRGMFESNESSISFRYTEETGRGFSIEGAADVRTSRVPDSGSIESLAKTLGCGERGEKAIRLLSEGYSRKEVVARLQVEPKWLDGLLVSARAQLSA